MRVPCPWCGEASSSTEIIPIPLLCDVVREVKKADECMREARVVEQEREKRQRVEATLKSHKKT
jgi:hypothetical protein